MKWVIIIKLQMKNVIEGQRERERQEKERESVYACMYEK
jgi:hypothetical protein